MDHDGHAGRMTLPGATGETPVDPANGQEWRKIGLTSSSGMNFRGTVAVSLAFRGELGTGEGVWCKRILYILVQADGLHF